MRLLKTQMYVNNTTTYIYAGDSGEDLDVLRTGTGNFQLTGEPLFHFNGMFFQSPPQRYSANDEKREKRVYEEAASAGFHPCQTSPREGRRKEQDTGSSFPAEAALFVFQVNVVRKRNKR